MSTIKFEKTKKHYAKPALNRIGTIEEITQAIGDGDDSDIIFNTSTVVYGDEEGTLYS